LFDAFLHRCYLNISSKFHSSTVSAKKHPKGFMFRVVRLRAKHMGVFAPGARPAQFAVRCGAGPSLRNANLRVTVTRSYWAFARPRVYNPIVYQQPPGIRRYRASAHLGTNQACGWMA
jgi:hypothetical protein